MNRITRVLAAFLSLSLVLSAPGLVSYRAAAQTISAARVGRLPPNIGSGAFSSYGEAVVPSIQPAAGLAIGLIPAPSLFAAPAVAASISALQPLALKAAVPAAATAGETAAPVAALVVLQSGGSAVVAAAKTSAQAAPRAALDGLFEGSAVLREVFAVSAGAAAVGTHHLEPSGASASAQGPRGVQASRGPNVAPPATSLKRTFAVGFLAAVIPMAITFASTSIAQLLGYHLHPNYQGAVGGGDLVPSMLQALSIWVSTAVMAPVSEEAIFRGGMQGGLAKLSGKLHLGSFVFPSLITSVIFVALHETADPLMFATRMVQAMILSFVYHKEGILSSMAAHGFSNGMLMLPLIFFAAGMPVLSAAPLLPLALYFAWRSAKLLRAQTFAVASGALAPKPMARLTALLFAALLLLGYFCLRPSDVWLIGSFLLVSYGLRRGGPKVPT